VYEEEPEECFTAPFRNFLFFPFSALIAVFGRVSRLIEDHGALLKLRACVAGSGNCGERYDCSQRLLF